MHICYVYQSINDMVPFLCGKFLRVGYFCCLWELVFTGMLSDEFFGVYGTILGLQEQGKGGGEKAFSEMTRHEGGNQGLGQSSHWTFLGFSKRSCSWAIMKTKKMITNDFIPSLLQLQVQTKSPTTTTSPNQVYFIY